MQHQELPITGYLDRFAHRPGETFAAQVSVRDGGFYRARLVRVIGGDPNPAGPGMRLDDLSRVFDQRFQGRRQEIRLGSHGIAPGPKRVAGACTWSVLVWTAAPRQGGTVLAQQDGAADVALSVGEDGVRARLSWPGGGVTLATGAGLPQRVWHRVFLAADPASGLVVVGQQALDGPEVRAEAMAEGMSLPDGGSVMFAAENAAAPCRHFTGKLEAPRIERGTQVLAAWDFADGIGSQTVRDTGPLQCHARLVNLPARAMAGSGWSGREMCWRHAPEDYAAIHFHDDDLGDCRWQTDFNWTVPDDLPSGAYALHLSCDAGEGGASENGAGEDWLPLYVLPKRQGPFAKIAFLASTFTYQAYANHARDNTDAAFLARIEEWGAYPHNADQYPIYGRSTYNRHSDRSGVCFSTRHRPMLTMRPGYLTFDDPLGSGLRHYPADTHLLGWLEAKGIPFDIITDEDLDEDGAAVLAPYRAVLTGSHPEYHTVRTLDALRDYTQTGGKLAYLGGNGFYWRIARCKEMPDVIELRRGEGGIRTWDAEPGEYYHQLDGQYGGLWRRNRRAPQMLVGVGFSGQGKFESTFYRRLPASYDPAFAWMFAGIGEETLGDYGLSAGGAAGFELDRADAQLGTPDNAVVLARSSTPPPPTFMNVPEELLSPAVTVTGEPLQDRVRGEIVYFDKPGGGAVFSVGSITFCGSLYRQGFEGPVSRLLENVVRHFLGET